MGATDQSDDGGHVFGLPAIDAVIVLWRGSPDLLSVSSALVQGIDHRIGQAAHALDQLQIVGAATRVGDADVR